MAEFVNFGSSINLENNVNSGRIIQAPALDGGMTDLPITGLAFFPFLLERKIGWSSVYQATCVGYYNWW